MRHKQSTHDTDLLQVFKRCKERIASSQSWARCHRTPLSFYSPLLRRIAHLDAFWLRKFAKRENNGSDVSTSSEVPSLFLSLSSNNNLKRQRSRTIQITYTIIHHKNTSSRIMPQAIATLWISTAGTLDLKRVRSPSARETFQLNSTSNEVYRLLLSQARPAWNLESDQNNI